MLLSLLELKFKLVLYPGFEQVPKHGVCGREESISSKDPLGQCIKDQTEICRQLVRATATLIFSNSHAVCRYNTWLISGRKLSLFFIRGPVGQIRFLKFWTAEQKLSKAPCPFDSPLVTVLGRVAYVGGCGSHWICQILENEVLNHLTLYLPFGLGPTIVQSPNLDTKLVL